MSRREEWQWWDSYSAPVKIVLKFCINSVLFQVEWNTEISFISQIVNEETNASVLDDWPILTNASLPLQLF